MTQTQYTHTSTFFKRLLSEGTPFTSSLHYHILIHPLTRFLSPDNGSQISPPSHSQASSSGEREGVEGDLLELLEGRWGFGAAEAGAEISRCSRAIGGRGQAELFERVLVVYEQ